MFKDQSESSFLRQREALKTVIEKSSANVITKTLKIASSDLFKGERSKLKTFLLQIEMNICFNKSQFKSDTDKVLYTATYLRDHAAK